MTTIFYLFLFYFFMLPVVFFRGFYAGSELTRLLFSFLSIALLAPFYIYQRAKLKAVLLQINLIHILGILFLLIIFISSVFSLNFNQAAFGAYPLSAQSLIFAFLVFTLIVVLSSFIKEINNIKTLIVFTTAGLSFNALLGTLDYLHQAIFLGNYSYRVASIEAHPIFFGVLMMLGLFFCLALRGPLIRGYKKVLNLGTALFLIGMVLSLSRGVWVSSIFSLLILLMIFIHTHKISSLSKHRNFFIYSFLLVVFTVLIFNQPIVGRIRELFVSNTKTTSHQIRYLELKDSLCLIWEKRIPFGIGPSQLPFYYPKFRSKELNQTSEWNLYPQQVRNNYLDVLIAFGPIALTIFLGIHVLVILGARRVLYYERKSEKNYLFFLFIFGSWLSLVFHGLFYYYNAISWIFFWFLTTIFVIKAKLPILLQLDPGKKLIWVLFFSQLLFSILAIIFVLKIFISELAYSEGLRLYNKISYLSQYKKTADNILFVKFDFTNHDKELLASAINKFNQAAAKSPYENSLYKRQLIHSVALLGRMQEDPNTQNRLYDTAYQQITYLIQKYPYDYFNFKVRASVTERILIDNPNTTNYSQNDVIDDYKKISYFDPTDPVNFDNLGLLYRDIGKAEESISMFKESIQLKNNYQPPYIHLGEVYEGQQKREEALKIYKEGLKIFPNNDLLDKKVKDLQSKL